MFEVKLWTTDPWYQAVQDDVREKDAMEDVKVVQQDVL